MRGLTADQSRCLASIRRLTKDGVAPSYRELQADLGLSSPSKISRLVQCLVERGAITRVRGAARSIAAVEAPTPADLKRLDSKTLRALAAHIAGILAHRDKNAPEVFHRIADRLEHKPRRSA